MLDSIFHAGRSTDLGLRWESFICWVFFVALRTSQCECRRVRLECL